MENQELINVKQGEIIEHKSYLNATDYKVARAFETKTEIDTETLELRANARARINQLEEEISVLQLEIEAEDSYKDSVEEI